MKFYSVCFLFVLFLTGCREPKPKTLFTLLSDSGIDFNNKVTDGKLDNSFYFRNFYNGGGVAIGDLDNDSLPDVLLTSNLQDNKLYLNKGNLKFEDISEKAGLRQDSMWSTGAVMADVNADGWLDIYVCNSGHMQDGNRRNKLYINNKDLTFTESAALFGLDIAAYCTQSSFFDYDLDGDLDCFIINNSPMPINNLGYTNRRELADSAWPVANFLKGGGDHLYRNDNGHFVEVTQAAGIHGTLMSFGLGVSVGDLNDDGYPDVYVANDSYERDYLYINQQNGTFRDEMEASMEHNSFSSMGADISDVNNDGLPDIFTTDMLPGDDYRLKTLGAFDNIDLHRTRIASGFYNQYMKNCLMINNGNGQFLETAHFSGVSATDWSWGALFFDADNDGQSDIYVCNGVNRDVTNLDFMDFFANDVVQKMVISGQKENIDSVLQRVPVHAVPNAVFRNTGDLRFTESGAAWGLDAPSFSNGAAYADLDRDGDLDLIVNNENQPAFVYQNNARALGGTNYIGIELQGRAPNSFAVGAKIKLFRSGEILYRELIPSRGFQSSMDYRQIIGLGDKSSVDSLVIVWPDGSYSRTLNPAINTVHYLKQDTTIQYKSFYDRVSIDVSAQAMLARVPGGFDKHTEDDYVDFYYQRNLPEMSSREGPRIAKGDLNGDGLEDVYIGGAKGSPGQFYLQNAAGAFVKKNMPLVAQFKDFEDVAVLFFDADRDRDLDLFIGAGGNHVQPGAREIQHRLYKNDGAANFTIDLASFPNNNMNISVAAANDFDEDGDMDLFVGSRSVPGTYGRAPTSYLYKNDGAGHFTDVAPPLLADAGMITGAVWTDVTNDKRPELVLTGQWMPTRIFTYRSNRFEELTDTGLEAMHGWWQSLKSADVNGDGLQDLVIGNLGENFYLKPEPESPVKLWYGDFDGNDIADAFLTRRVAGNDVPVFLKREVTDQFPALKKENLKHSDYAGKDIVALFPAAVLKKAVVKEFNYARSILAINLGGGTFRVTALPLAVQLSSVNAICPADINGDGNTDLLLGGNLFGFPPQFGRLDASYGHLLLNRGDGSFRYLNTQSSGLFLRGEIKDIQEVSGGANRAFLITQNDSVPALYRGQTRRNPRNK